jgi:hypothetical protein
VKGLTSMDNRYKAKISLWYSIINRYNNTGFELKSKFHSKFGGNLKEISILKTGNTIIMQTLAGNLLAAMDHLHYRLNFDLDKNFITA